MLIPALFPHGCAWIAACSAFINNMVGAQCVIILRDTITVLALVTHFPLHSSRAGSCTVACLDLARMLGQPQNLSL